jgi:uncharacterized protein with GYD domain
MTTPNNERDKLIRVQGPALPVVRLASEADSSTPVSELIRVQGPALQVVKLMSEPVTPIATVQLTLPRVAGAEGERRVQTLRSLIEKVNEMEALFDRTGVCVSKTALSVGEGEVVIVLTPNDPTDALETCMRVAKLLFEAARKTGGVALRVFKADEPETPVCELAA